jgi:hypothetical protein
VSIDYAFEKLYQAINVLFTNSPTKWSRGHLVSDIVMEQLEGFRHLWN